MLSSSLSYTFKLYLLLLLLFLSLSFSPGLFSTTYASSNQTCQCIAFRLDDIQDYYLNHVQTEIIRAFQDSGTSLTIGLIGNSFGNDSALLFFINQTLHKGGASNLEIANHGWTHENFTSYSTDAQYQLMLKTNDKAHKLLNIIVRGFIAPYNELNYGTILAAEKNQMNYVSSDLSSYDPIVGKNNVTTDSFQNMVYLPETLSVGGLNTTENTWELRSNLDIVNEIQDSLNRFGMAVITLHPMNYAIKYGPDFQNRINGSRINELEILLKEISEKGWKIGTLEDMANFYRSNLFPTE
jgi:peptidoglycan/xylan/chitin deacetylase (PgdA/CDA1 family)